MKLGPLVICSALCLTADAQTQTKTTAEILLSSPFRQKLLSQPHEETFFEQVTVRIEERADSRLTHRLTLDLRLDDPRIDPQEFAAKRGKFLFRDGFQFAFREWGLQTPAYQWFDIQAIRVGDWFSGFLHDTLSGNEERNNVQSPSELEFVAKRNRFRGLKKGLRPFDGYAFVGYGLTDDSREPILESTLRFYLRGWNEPTLSLMTEIPIRDWSLGVGLEGRGGGDRERQRERYGRLFKDVDHAFDVTVGLKGPLKGGLVYIGAGVMNNDIFALWRRSF